MQTDSLPRPTPNVIYQSLAEGAVLLLPAEELYFGLNEVGAFIWSQLPPVTGTFADLCDKVCERYADVARSTIEQDVKELIEELLSQGLVTNGLGSA